MMILTSAASANLTTLRQRMAQLSETIARMPINLTPIDLYEITTQTARAQESLDDLMLSLNPTLAELDKESQMHGGPR